ncbi:MAG: DUF5829 family protein [Chitinophagales bacterium]
MIKCIQVCLYFLPFFTHAQPSQIPQLSFNHLYVVLRNEDLHAIQHLDFVKKELAGFEIRTSTGSSETWTGTYLYGINNYIEFFDTSSYANAPLGSIGIGFSADRLKDLNLLQSLLSEKYPMEPFVQEKETAAGKIPWFHGLYINDAVFYNQSALGFWMMAYDTAYFNYYKLPYQDDLLTKEAYLKRYDEDRKGKIITRFDGAVLNLTAYEQEYFSKFLLQAGFTLKDTGIFTSQDGLFTFAFNEQTERQQTMLAVLTFVTDTSGTEKRIEISPNVCVVLHKKRGEIIFR